MLQLTKLLQLDFIKTVKEPILALLLIRLLFLTRVVVFLIVLLLIRHLPQGNVPLLGLGSECVETILGNVFQVVVFREPASQDIYRRFLYLVLCESCLVVVHEFLLSKIYLRD
jgi:hypothetical protein